MSPATTGGFVGDICLEGGRSGLVSFRAEESLSVRITFRDVLARVSDWEVYWRYNSSCRRSLSSAATLRIDLLCDGRRVEWGFARVGEEWTGEGDGDMGVLGWIMVGIGRSVFLVGVLQGESEGFRFTEAGSLHILLLLLFLLILVRRLIAWLAVASEVMDGKVAADLVAP